MEAEEHIFISGLYSPNFLVRSSKSLDNYGHTRSGGLELFNCNSGIKVSHSLIEIYRVRQATILIRSETDQAKVQTR